MTSTTALRLEGRDALALLHRIGTQKLDDLAPGQARSTLFCDFRGRLLHRAVVAVTRDGAVWLLRDDAPGADLAAFLDRHVFRDDVRIEDRSATLPVSSSAVGPNVAVTEKDGVPTLVDCGDAHPLAIGAVAATSDARERVRAGRAGHGHEIVEAFNPFEVGLAHEVHLDKGCFTGQEVLMRLVTYHSAKRRLARIAGSGATPATPVDLKDGDQVAGVLTTAVSDGARWIGLAVLKHEVVEAARPLVTAAGAATEPPEALPLTRALGRP